MNMSSEPGTEPGPQATNEVPREVTELRAYFKYCERGCEPGYDVDDWLAAEREILAERAAATLKPPERLRTSPEGPRRQITRDGSART